MKDHWKNMLCKEEHDFRIWGIWSSMSLHMFRTTGLGKPLPSFLPVTKFITCFSCETWVHSRSTSYFQSFILSSFSGKYYLIETSTAQKRHKLNPSEYFYFFSKFWLPDDCVNSWHVKATKHSFHLTTANRCLSLMKYWVNIVCNLTQMMHGKL